MEQHIVYGLHHPNDLDKVVRYVGYTKNISKRLVHHLIAARRFNRNYLHHWLNKLVREGLKPAYVVIEEVTKDNWQERERFWILQFSGLVNSTAGGEGLVNPSEDVRRRIAASVSIATKGNKYRLGIPHTEEDRRRISKGLLTSDKKKAFDASRRGKPGHKTSEETKEKIRQKKLGKPRPWTPEWSANIAAGHRGLKQSPETIAKRARSMSGNQNGLGHVKSQEARDAIGRARIGSRAITDGTQRKMLKAGEPLPSGWKFTRLREGD